MKMFKRIMAAALVGAMAITALVGCSQTASGETTAFTMNGTVKIESDGQTSEGTVLMASDGKIAYSKYIVGGTVMESIADETYTYERTYADGAAAGKWTKNTTPAAAETTTVKSGVMTIDAKVYQTQTYDDVTYYCFNNSSELKYIFIKDAEGDTTIKIDTLTYEADAALMQLPAADEVE